MTLIPTSPRLIIEPKRNTWCDGHYDLRHRRDSIQRTDYIITGQVQFKRTDYITTGRIQFNVLTTLPQVGFNSTYWLHYHRSDSIQRTDYITTGRIQFKRTDYIYHRSGSIQRTDYITTGQVQFNVTDYITTGRIQFNVLTTLPQVGFNSTYWLHYHRLDSIQHTDYITTGWIQFNILTTLPQDGFNSTYWLHYHRSGSIQHTDYIVTQIQGFLEQKLKKIKLDRRYSCNIWKICNIIGPKN